MKALLEEIDDALIVERQQVIDITPKSSDWRQTLGGMVVVWTTTFIVTWLVRVGLEKLFKKMGDAWNIDLTKKQKKRISSVAQRELEKSVGQRLNGRPDDSEFNVKGAGVGVMMFWRIYDEEVTNKIEQELKSILEKDSGVIRSMRIGSRVKKALQLAVSKNDKKIATMISEKHDEIMRSTAAKKAREKGYDVSEDQLSPTKGDVYINKGGRDLEIVFECAYRY